MEAERLWPKEQAMPMKSTLSLAKKSLTRPRMLIWREQQTSVEAAL
jgi:hypothetical protein